MMLWELNFDFSYLGLNLWDESLALLSEKLTIFDLKVLAGCSLAGDFLYWINLGYYKVSLSLRILQVYSHRPFAIITFTYSNFNSFIVKQMIRHKFQPSHNFPPLILSSASLKDFLKVFILTLSEWVSSFQSYLKPRPFQLELET